MWDFADVYKKDQFAFSYLTLHEWNYKKQKGKSVTAFLHQYGYNKIAVYSLGALGNLFLEDAVREGVSVSYVVDKNSSNFPKDKFGVPIIGLDALSQQEDVDAIVICHVYYYNQIADTLVALGIPENKILSLNDIVFSM